MKQPVLHKVEVSILYALRRTVSARFSYLMKPTGLSSDSFKFYLRRLIELHYVEKTPTGDYLLTTQGKEFANSLDKTKLIVQKQPKVSVLIIIPKPNDGSKFLFQRRLRHPYYNFYGAISGPVKWGEEIEEAAQRELMKQTGLQGTFSVKAFYRQKDYDTITGALLEDKLFAVIDATVIEDELTNSWTGGHNEWITISDYKEKKKRFATTDRVLDMLHQKIFYTSSKTNYGLDVY